jgi:hypothetical protein
VQTDCWARESTDGFVQKSALRPPFLFKPFTLDNESVKPGELNSR